MSIFEKMALKAAGNLVENGLKELQRRDQENGLAAQVGSLQAAVAERDKIIKGLTDQLSDRAAEVAQLERLVNEVEEQNTRLLEQVSEDLEDLEEEDDDEIAADEELADASK